MYHQDPIPSEKARFEYLHSFYSKINRGISRPSLLVHKLLTFYTDVIYYLTSYFCR